jgi:hypothetical protein
LYVVQSPSDRLAAAAQEQGFFCTQFFWIVYQRDGGFDIGTWSMNASGFTYVALPCQD